MDRVNDAYALMSTAKMNCAQAVLSTYCEQFGLERDPALKLAQGFGGGMGRTGSTCGAVNNILSNLPDINAKASNGVTPFHNVTTG